MIQRFYAALLMISISIAMFSSNSITIAQKLAVRLMGQKQADRIIFKEIDSDTDKFILYSNADKIVIAGNSTNSMAVGLGHYLKYICLTNISWDSADDIQLPDKLPVISSPITRKAIVENRFYLNYCTFGYTMVWWQWKNWERFIDWMAINGVNLPLSITGQEAVWYKVWKKLGLSDTDIRSYFTGPSHLPWHRMINLDYWQGPLPMSWLRHQENLQKKIVKRERELGMHPILPAFAGHVPASLKKIYPNAKISQTSSWGGFKDKYRSHFLDPEDTLFAVIQNIYLKEQTKLYGTDHYYGIDPFNEIDPPCWEPDFLNKVGKKIYNSLLCNDTEAKWVQMTWLFYIDRSNWTAPRINAFLNSVPHDRLILLDYFAENTEVWKKTDSYYGHKFIWCYLGNFGGNTMLAGNFAETGRRINYAIRNAKSITGIGSTLEGIDCNPIMYEFVFDHAWSPLQNDYDWVSSWADRRIGCKNEANREAWHLLIDSIYSQSASLGQAPLVNSRPSFSGFGNWTTNPNYSYNNEILGNVMKKMLEATDSLKHLPDAQLFDMTNVLRQYLSNRFLEIRDSFTVAYNAKSLDNAEFLANKMKQMLNDIEKTVSLHSYFSFGKWIYNAEQFAKKNNEREYYRRSACTILTTWGETPQSLNDYASRTWSGLVSGYYAPRWQMFLDTALCTLRESRPFDKDKYIKTVTDFEREISAGRISLPPKNNPEKNPLDVMREILYRYSK